LIEYAERFFQLQKTIGDTTQTLFESLKIIAEKKKVHPDTLYKLPKCNPKILYLIEWFYDLKKSPEPITYSEIEAWSKLTNKAVTPNEVEAIMRLDLQYSITNKPKKDK